MGSDDRDSHADDRTRIARTVVDDARVEAEASDASGGGGLLVGGRYRILALVGTGGMGSVYRVRDCELDEVVALKMLRSRDADASGVDALRREVKLARRVTHKNVARTYDIGEHGGQRFLTMEYVDGAPLDQIGEVNTTRALRVARAIAEGLGAAHEAGIVHRDLKPSNVLLERTGRVVITDFGVACLGVRARAGEAPETAGWAGTPVYMAPEQLLGRADLDARADLYALGEILFELLTGRRVWNDEDAAKAAFARLTDAPPDPRELRSDLAAPVADIVARLLAPRREERYASAADVLEALAPLARDPAHTPDGGSPTWIAALAGAERRAPRGAREVSVAVLPFRTEGGAPDYVADGVGDDLADTLSTTHALRVRPRSVVRAVGDAAIDPVAAGRELGVDAVIEGNVRAASAMRYEIDLRVVAVRDAFELWARSYPASVAELLVVTDEAGRAIGEALTAHVTGPPGKPANDPVAIELYLRARQQLGARAYGGDVDEAVAMLEEALAREPDEPNLLAALAIARSRVSHTSESARLALEAATRATLLAPHLAEGWLALASVLQMSGDLPGTVRASAQALRCSPHLARAHHLIGDLMYQVGWSDEGIRRCELALALDPSLRGPAISLALARALRGELDAARAALVDPSLAGGPVSVIAAGTRARLAAWLRARVDRAELPELAELGTSGAADERAPAPLIARLFGEMATTGTASAAALGAVRALRTLASALMRSFVGQIEAEAWAFLGDTERALDAIEFAEGQGLVDVAWLRGAPLLAPLRASARFGSVAARVDARAARVREALVAEGFSAGR